MWNENFSPHFRLASDFSEFFQWGATIDNLRGCDPLATSFTAGASRHLEASFQGFMEL
jgi:hypothetical protein